MIGGVVGAMGRSQKRTHDVQRYPAPLGGVDLRKAIGSDDPSTCVYTYNLVPYEYGMRIRQGYREWQIDVDNGAGLGVSSIIPYYGATTATDKLFVATNEGIWDVTNAGGTPVLKVAFPIVTAAAGSGTSTAYTTDAGASVMFFADSANGLYQYTASTDTWAFNTTITGVDPINIRAVVVFKSRIWFVEKNTNVAWYLAVGAIAGAATAFYFGSKFRSGGALKGLFNWTVDGGEGVDDMFVAVSRAGDVIVYKGEDPSSATWEQVGVFFIGRIPNSAKFGSEHGGELYLLSVYGLVSMNDLLQGVDANVLQTDAVGSSLTLKIGVLIRDNLQATLELEGWDVSPIPCEGGLLVSSPTQGTEAPIQYYYNMATQGWGFWRDVPMRCFEQFGDSVYLGTADGRVMRMDVPLDNVELTPANPLANGVEINFSILSAYSALKSAGVYKNPVIIRPDFVSTLAPTQSSVAVYDYSITEPPATNTGTPIGLPTGLWDITDWDAAIWGGRDGITYNSVGGTWGKGRYVAIATRGSARTTTRLIGWDLIYTTGGVMS
tara:strand:+ start:15339 stop:16985 length:1647 start_codon:yes stop_codon:yes gene_type:complete